MNKEKPLVLIANDDSIHAKGLKALIEVVEPLANLVVVSTEMPMSGKSSSLTVGEPIRIREVASAENVKMYVITGTPVDCMKLAYGNLLERKPDLVVTGINHGANSSINVLYSGTMGAAIEACLNKTPAIGFSLLDHSPDADFSAAKPFVREIILDTLAKGLPEGVCLNVNIPSVQSDEIKGMKVCRQAHSFWKDSFEKRIDPYGYPYWWLTGISVCESKTPETDLWALENNYISIVPTQVDMTDHKAIKQLEGRYENMGKK